MLEAGQIGFGCSGRNGGQVNPGLKELPDQVERHFGSERGSRLNAMASDAAAEVFGLIEQHGIDCAPRRTGTIRAAIDEAGETQIQQLVTQAAARGWPVHHADAAEMRRLTGSDMYRAGAFDARGGHINPLAYARGLALAAERAGAALYGDSGAQTIDRQGPDWKITTARGSVQAAQILIATNGYSGKLWPGLRQALIPVYTYITATDPLPQPMRDAIMPCGSALYEAAWDVVYYRLDDAGRLIMGGRGAQRDARGAQDYRHLVDYARKLWPILGDTAFPWHWHGQVAVTPDHFPHLVAPEAGVHLMFGYNGRGIAVSTAAGRMAAQRILSGGTQDVALPVDRDVQHVPFHRFWRQGAEMSMAWYKLRDRIRGR